MQECLVAVWRFIVYVFWVNGLTTIPIAISLVAILISVATAKKQNKIALFELRYRCYYQLRTIRSFDASIYDCEDPEIILKMFDALWGTSISKVSGEESIIRARCHMELIANDVLQREFLFNHKFYVDPFEILRNVQRILIDATGGEINGNAQKELHQLCEQFEKHDLKYMCRKLKL